MALRRFTADVDFIYKGFLLADMYFKVAGKEIVFKIRDANAAGFGSFGMHSFDFQ